MQREVGGTLVCVCVCVGMGDDGLNCIMKINDDPNPLFAICTDTGTGTL